MATGGRGIRIERRAGGGDCGGTGGVRDRQRDGRQHREPEHAMWRERTRPTYGRVPRTGAMTLCWSLDKLGPMTRSVEDTMLVLQAITGPECRRSRRVCPVISTTTPVDRWPDFAWGISPSWMKENPPRMWTARRWRRLRKVGMVPVAVTLPDWPFDSLNVILFSEGAAAFEELTLSHQMDQLGAGVAGRVAQSVPRGAVSVGGGFRAGRPDAPPGRQGDGADLFAGRSAPRAVIAQ